MTYQLEKIIAKFDGKDTLIDGTRVQPLIESFNLDNLNINLCMYTHRGRGIVIASQKSLDDLCDIVKEACEDFSESFIPTQIFNAEELEDHFITVFEPYPKHDMSEMKVHNGSKFGATVLLLPEIFDISASTSNFQAGGNFEIHSADDKKDIHIFSAERLKRKIKDISGAKKIIIRPVMTDYSDDSQVRVVRGELVRRAYKLLHDEKIPDSEGKYFKYKVEGGEGGVDGITPGATMEVLSDYRGVVFKARRVYDEDDTVIDPIVVKLFHNVPKESPDPKLRKGYRDEIEILKSAGKSKRIIKITLDGLIAGYSFYEMPLGIPLDRMFDEGEKLSKEDILQIICDVCEGASYLYNEAQLNSAPTKSGRIIIREKKNIVHRDIKPPNILLFKEEGKWRAKLADFNLAKATFVNIGSISRSFIELGSTVNYAPECLLDDKITVHEEEFERECRDGKKIKYTASTDTYSIGVCIYQMLIGKESGGGLLPFENDPNNRLKDDIVNALTIPRSPEVMNRLQNLGFNDVELKYLEGVIRKCMQPLPSKRYQSAEELLTALKDGWEKITTIPARMDSFFRMNNSFIHRISNIESSSGIGGVIDGLVRDDLKEQARSIIRSYCEINSIDFQMSEDDDKRLSGAVNDSVVSVITKAMDFLSVEGIKWKNGRYSSGDDIKYSSYDEGKLGRDRIREDLDSLSKIVESLHQEVQKP